MHVVIFPATLFNLLLFGLYVFEMAYDDDTPTLPAPMLMAAWCFVLPFLCKRFFRAYRSILKERLVKKLTTDNSEKTELEMSTSIINPVHEEQLQPS